MTESAPLGEGFRMALASSNPCQVSLTIGATYRSQAADGAEWNASSW